MLENVLDPVDWLSREIRVAYPGNAELMTISLTGSDPTETANLVNAVLDAYKSVVVDKEKNDQGQRLTEIDDLAVAGILGTVFIFLAITELKGGAVSILCVVYSTAVPAEPLAARGMGNARPGGAAPRSGPPGDVFSFPHVARGDGGKPRAEDQAPG